MKTNTVLFVDDDKTVLMIIEKYLESEPYERIYALSPAEALGIMSEKCVDVIVSDINMPDMSGLEMLEKIRNMYPDTVRMVLTGDLDSELVISAINNGEVYRYLNKPLNEPLELKSTVNQAIEYYELRQCQKKLFFELEQKNRELSNWKIRTASELELAGSVQRQILCRPPVSTPSLTARFAYHPSSTVGGDFFDTILLPEGRTCVYVGDVAGHGAGSALISTLLKLTVSDIVTSHSHEGPASVCRRINDYMYTHGLSREDSFQFESLFATMFIALYYPEENIWRSCSCGHEIPVLMDKNGEPKKGAIPKNGTLPLGFYNNPDLYAPEHESTWSTASEDVLFFFTDGLYEARNAKGEFLGTRNLTRLLSDLVRTSCDTPDPDSVLRTISDIGYDTSVDDCCAIFVRMLPDI